MAVVRELPTFKGYTVDERLEEFRIFEYGKPFVQVKFDSKKGKRLLREWRAAQLPEVAWDSEGRPVCPKCREHTLSILSLERVYQRYHTDIADWGKEIDRDMVRLLDGIGCPACDLDLAVTEKLREWFRVPGRS